MNWNRSVGLAFIGLILIAGGIYNALEGNIAVSVQYDNRDVERWRSIWGGYWLPFNDFIQYYRVPICFGMALLGLIVLIAATVDLIRQLRSRTKASSRS